MSSMFEICSEFAMISLRGAIERAHWMRLSNGQSCLSIAPRIEIFANLLQISNIELIFTKYSNEAFKIFCYNDIYSSRYVLTVNLFFKSLI